MAARTPRWLLTYEGVDVSDAVEPYCKRIAFTDQLHGKSDDLEISLEDSQGLWRGPWYPSKGDRLHLRLGIEGEPLLDAGRFQVDTIELGGGGSGGSGVTVRALAAGVVAPTRTRATRSFVDLSLRDIAERVAREHDLVLVGDPPTTARKLTVQNAETDLAFLTRLAAEWGYAFSVRGEQLVFYEVRLLEEAETTVKISRSDARYNFNGSVQDTYLACEVSYLDPGTGELLWARVEAAQVRSRTATVTSGGAAEPVVPMVLLGLRRADRPERVSEGPLVAEWQRFLVGRGLYAGRVDGEFNPLTDRATRLFQKRAKIGVDGVVGPDTFGAAITLGFDPGAADERVPGGNVLRLSLRCESHAEAETKAAAALRAANRLSVQGTISMPGHTRVLAGTKLEFEDPSRLGGTYLVQRSTHAVSRQQGYTTEAEVTHV